MQRIFECEEVTKFLTNENRALLDKKNYMEAELLKANENLVELRIELKKDCSENSTSEKNHSYLRHLEIENVILKRHITVKDELLIKQITIIKCLTGKLLQLEAYYNRLEGMAEKYEKKDVGVTTCPVGICTRGVNCKIESKGQKKKLCDTCSINRCELDETIKDERPCDVCSIGRCDLDGLDLEPGDLSGIRHDNVEGEPAGTPKDLDRIDTEENKVKCPCEVVYEEGEDMPYKCDTCDCYVESPKVCPFGVCSVCRCPIPPADDGDDGRGFRGTAVMVNKEVSCPVKVGNTGTNTTVQPMAYRDLGTETTKAVGRQTGVTSSCPVGCSCCICTADERVAGCVGPNQDGGDIEALMKGGIRGKTDPSLSVSPESTGPVGQEVREESISPGTVDASAIGGTIDNMQYSIRQDGTIADASQSTRGIIDTRQLGMYPDAMASKVPGTCPDICDGICRNAVQTSDRPGGEIGTFQSIPPGTANADMRGTIDTRQYGMYPDAMVSKAPGTCPDTCDGICRNVVKTSDQPGEIGAFQSIPPGTADANMRETVDTRQYGMYPDAMLSKVPGICPGTCEGICRKAVQTGDQPRLVTDPSQSIPPGTVQDDTHTEPSQSVEGNTDTKEDGTRSDPSQTVDENIDTKEDSTQADPSHPVEGTIDTKENGTPSDPSQSVELNIDTEEYSTQADPSQSVEGTIDTKEYSTQADPSQPVEGTIDTKEDGTHVELSPLKIGTIDTRQDGTDVPVICRDTCDEACQQPAKSGGQAVGEMDPSHSISPGKYQEPGAPESVAPSVQEGTDSKIESAVMQYTVAQGTEICNTCPSINIVCPNEPGASGSLAENVQGRTKSDEACIVCPPEPCEPVCPETEKNLQQEQAKTDAATCNTCPPTVCPTAFPKIESVVVQYAVAPPINIAFPNDGRYYTPGSVYPKIESVVGQQQGKADTDLCHVCPPQQCPPGFTGTGIAFAQQTGMTGAGFYETGAFRPGMLRQPTGTTGAGIYETGAFRPGMLRQPTGTTGAGIYETGAFRPGMLRQQTGTTGAGIYETGTFHPERLANETSLEGECPDMICVNSCVCVMDEDPDISSEDYQLYGGPKKAADTKKKTRPTGSPCWDCKDPCKVLADKVCGEDKITQEPEDDSCGHQDGRRDSTCQKCVANTCSPSKGHDCHKSAVTIIEPTSSSLGLSSPSVTTLEPCPIDVCKSEMCIPVRCRDPNAPGEGGAACQFCQEECEDIMEEISVLTETEELGTRRISIVSQEACGSCVKETCKTGRVCCKNRGKSLLYQKEECGLCLVSEPILSDDIYGRDKGATKIAISCKICRLPCKSSCGDSTVLESKSEMGLYVVCRTCTGAIITDDPTNPSEQICSCVECTTAKEIHSTKEVMDVREQSSDNYATAPCGSSGDETHQHSHPTYRVVTSSVQSSPELDRTRQPPSGASISTQPSFSLKETGNAEDLTVNISVEESRANDLVVSSKKYRSDFESPSTKTCSLEFSTCSSQTLSGDHASEVRSSSGSLSKEKEYAGISRKEFERDDDEKNGNDARELTHRDEINVSELKLTIAELKNKLLDAEDKIDDLKSIHMIDAKDNNKALMQMYSNEIEELRKELKQAAQEKEDQAYLKERIKLLETSKGNSDHITTNLNTAVDLYINTIGVLEAAEEKSKLEIEQQRVTISNLQEALIVTKQELEKLKTQSHQDMEELLWFNKQLYFDITDLKQNNDVYHEQIKKNRSYFEKLVEFNFDLEVQHVNSLQDVSMLETKIYDCQNIFKSYEDEKNGMKVQIKKLYKKNRCYEEIVDFFKSEMAVMSDELLTLQEVLNLTNVTTQEENNKLMNAIFQLRRINDRLVGHLCEIEKQMVLENQVNQINESRINELQQIISTKNHDLNQHDEVLRDLRRKLSNAANQNAELRKTICSLNENVATMKHDLTRAQDDQHQTKEEVKEVESQMSLANDNLEEVKGHLAQKKRKIAELEKNLRNREESLAATEKELQTFKDKQMEKLSTSKELINSLKEQLAHSEMKNKQMAGDYQEVARQLQDFSNIDKAKHYELSHYKSLVDEMKQSLIQMNVNLVRCEATNIHFLEELGDENEFASCPTIANVFAELKQSMVHMRSRLSQADVKNTALEEECLKTNAKCSQIEETQEKKERDYLETQKKLEKRVKMAVEEQSRLTELVEQQKRQLDKLNKELQNKNDQDGFENAKSLIEQVKHEKIPQMCSHGEASSLKCELNKSLQRQVLLNDENEKLHNQLLNLRTKLTMVEQDNDGLKRQSDEFNLHLKRATKEKEYLTIKNQELSKTLVQLRCTHNSMEKQCRTLMEQLSHEECWSIHQQKFLQRQQVKEPSKQTPPSYYEQSPNVLPKKSPAKFQQAYLDPRNCRYVTSPRQKPYYRSEDGRQSSSTSSKYLRDYSYDSASSPCSTRSPSPHSLVSWSDIVDGTDPALLCDWFSPNFRENDTDENDDDSFVNKVQIMTAQVQEANKRWQKKMNKEIANVTHGIK